MSILDKVTDAGKHDAEADLNLDDSEFGEEFPGLFEFLARRRYKGQDRLTGRLVIYTEPEKACICLCDKHTSQVCFYTSDSVNGALEGLEKQLQAGRCDWRRDRRARIMGK